MAGQKIRIRLKAYDHEAIDASARKIVETVTRTGASVVGPVPLPTEKNVYCVIRSPHKYKDSREHFEMRTHKRLIDILDPTPKTPLTRSAHRSAGQCRRQHPVGDPRKMARKGILGTKLGMTQVFDENNKVVPMQYVGCGAAVHKAAADRTSDLHDIHERAVEANGREPRTDRGRGHVRPVPPCAERRPACVRRPTDRDRRRAGCGDSSSHQCGPLSSRLPTTTTFNGSAPVVLC